MNWPSIEKDKVAPSFLLAYYEGYKATLYCNISWNQKKLNAVP